MVVLSIWIQGSIGMDTNWLQSTRVTLTRHVLLQAVHSTELQRRTAAQYFFLNCGGACGGGEGRGPCILDGGRAAPNPPYPPYQPKPNGPYGPP